MEWCDVRDEEKDEDCDEDDGAEEDEAAPVVPGAVVAWVKC